MFKELGFIVAILLFVAGVIGWVMNIVALAGASEFSGLLLLRAVGIFVAPLGAVLGWI